MSRKTWLVGWLLVARVAAPANAAAAPSTAERKPLAAASKTSAPTKLPTAPSKPRATKPATRHVPEAAHRPATGTSAALRSAPLPVVSPPRLDRTAAGAAPRPSIEARIAAAREVYQAGRYAEVPTTLIKLLTESQLTPSQLAVVYELLASAYVALGQTELAIRCFSEVLTRRPAFALDPVRTSPKIRAALDQARAAAAPRRPM